MATIRGTAGNDTISPAGNSAGVTGGLPTTGFNLIIGSAGSDLINAGSDRSNLIDYSALSTGVAVTFGSVAGPYTVSKGALGNDTLVGGGWYNVVGSSGADSFVVTGPTTNRVFNGGAGNDTVDGGLTRAASLRYDNSPSGILVDLAAGSAQDGFGGTDTVRNIASVRGSDFNDTIRGSGSSDSRAFEIFDTGDGDDFYDGLDGTVTQIIDYGFATRFETGVRIRLTGADEGIARKPGGQGTDTFVGIEQLDGSFADDVFNGAVGSTTGPQRWVGNGGNDVFRARGDLQITVDLAGSPSFSRKFEIDLRTNRAEDDFDTSILKKVVSVQATFDDDDVQGSARSESVVTTGGDDTCDMGGATTPCWERTPVRIFLWSSG